MTVWQARELEKCGALDSPCAASSLMVTCITLPDEGIMMDRSTTPPIERPEGLAERLIDVHKATEDFVNADCWRVTLRWHPLLHALAVCVRLDEDEPFVPPGAYVWLARASWDDLDTLACIAGLTALNMGLSSDDMLSRGVASGSHAAGMILGRRTSPEDLVPWETMQLSHTIQSMDIHDRLVLLDLAQAVFRLAEFSHDEILSLRH